MKAIKLYRVFNDDIEDGKVKKDARLVPFYANQYQWDEKNSPVETPESVDVYDNSTNVHKNRYFNLYKADKNPKDIVPEFGKNPYKNAENRILDNSKAVNRGYSAIGYIKNRNNVFADWSHDDPSVSKEELRKREFDSWKDDGSGQDYELNSAVYYPNDIVKLPKEEDRANLINVLRSMYGANVAQSADGRGNVLVNGKMTSVVPYVIEYDPEDAITLDDVLKRGYAPGVDFPQEIDTKKIKAKSIMGDILNDKRYYDKLPEDIVPQMLDAYHTLAMSPNASIQDNKDVEDAAEKAKSYFEVAYARHPELFDDDSPTIKYAKNVVTGNESVYRKDPYGRTVIDPRLEGAVYNFVYNLPKANDSRYWDDLVDNNFNIEDDDVDSDVHLKQIAKDLSKHNMLFCSPNAEMIAGLPERY